jgi:putative oxidoreductase
MSALSPRMISVGLLVLRAGIGCMMLVHGIPKLVGFREMSAGFPDPIGVGSQISLILAVGAEVGCSAMLIAGAWTRLAAIPLAITMCVALFMIHGADPWQAKELAAIYLLVYVSLIFTGGGEICLDNVLRRRSQSKT